MHNPMQCRSAGDILRIHIQEEVTMRKISYESLLQDMAIAISEKRKSDQTAFIRMLYRCQYIDREMLDRVISTTKNWVLNATEVYDNATGTVVFSKAEFSYDLVAKYMNVTNDPSKDTHSYVTE